MTEIDAVDSSWDDEDELEESVPADDPAAVEERKLVEYGESIVDNYLIGSKQLLSTARLTPDWLVEGAIPKKTVNLIVGKPETNKSWLAYELVLALVEQRPWLIFPTVPVVSPTAFVLNYDNPDTELARRFKRMGLREDHRVFFHSIGAHLPPGNLPATLQFPGGFEPLYAMVYAKRPDIIVIDSHRQAHTLDDNDNQQMALFMSQLRQLAGLGAAVIAVHHTRKDDDVLRGAVEIEAALDSAILVSDKVATWVKTRGWTMQEAAVAFGLEDVGDSTRVVTGMTLRQVLAAGPLSRADIAGKLGLSEANTARRMIERAISAGYVRESKGSSRLVELVER